MPYNFYASLFPTLFLLSNFQFRRKWWMGLLIQFFIFSLINKEGLTSFKSMVNSPQHAIYRESGYGPIFGGGHAILISNFPTVTLIHTQTFVTTTTTYQVEYRTGKQSLLELTLISLYTHDHILLSNII